MVFFINMLQAGGQFESLMEQAPLTSKSPNAPQVRDGLGTVLLSILAGANRYAQGNALRDDGVNPDLLGMKRVGSDDAVRRAMRRIEEGAGLRKQLEGTWRPWLGQDGVLSVDTTGKPLYGKQAGAVAGYNPLKRGRPSHGLPVGASSSRRRWGARMRSTRASSAGPSPRGGAKWRPMLSRVHWRTLEPQRTRRWGKWDSWPPARGLADEQAPMGAGLGAEVRKLQAAMALHLGFQRGRPLQANDLRRKTHRIWPKSLLAW